MRGPSATWPRGSRARVIRANVPAPRADACACRSLLSEASSPDADVVRALNALGAHEDLRQRALVEQILRARPRLLAPYLASMPSAWEPRASFRFLALHAHLARFLGAVPIAAVVVVILNRLDVDRNQRARGRDRGRGREETIQID